MVASPYVASIARRTAARGGDFNRRTMIRAYPLKYENASIRAEVPKEEEGARACV